MAKQKQNLLQLLTNPKHMAVGAVILACGVIVLTIFTVFLAQQTLEETQDIRPQASTTDTQVEITAQPGNNAHLTINQPVVVNLLVNTHDLETAGVQLVFDVTHTDAQGLLDFSVQVEGNLSITTNIQPIDQGFRIQMMALAPEGSPFTTSEAIQLIGLNFKPLEVGQIFITFDNDQSHSTLAGQVPPEDKLATLGQLVYQVINPISPSTTPQPSPTPSPTLKGCNEICESSLECANNHYCYHVDSDWRCRLADNPTSSTCQSLPDQGLNRTCNQYCADSNECSSGLTCWYNKCRLLSNIENTNCTPLNSTQQVAQDQLCNAVCSTNADCAVNLRCFNGGCRLAVNPSSPSCSLPPIQPIVQTPVISKGTAVTPPATQDDQTQLSPTTPPEDNSASGSLSETVPTIAPTGVASSAQPNALSELINSLRQSGRLLPVGVLVLGLILLLASFLASMLGKPSQHGKSSLTQKQPADSPISPPSTITMPKQPTASPPSDMVERLKEKGVQPPQ